MRYLLFSFSKKHSEYEFSLKKTAFFTEKDQCREMG